MCRVVGLIFIFTKLKASPAPWKCFWDVLLAAEVSCYSPGLPRTSLQPAVVSLPPGHVSARNPSGPQVLGRAGARELVSKGVASALCELCRVGAFSCRKNQSLITGWSDLKSSTLTALEMGCWRLGAARVHFWVAFSAVLPPRVESIPRRKQLRQESIWTLVHFSAVMFCFSQFNLFSKLSASYQQGLLGDNSLPPTS